MKAGRRSLACFWRHSGLAPDPVGRAFDDAAFDRIEAAIVAGESRHRGEVRFALESRLAWHALRRGLTARERALQVFGEQRIWDTEENTGILIYLLTADRAVEIIADRLVHQRLPAGIWHETCQQIVSTISHGNPVDGVVSAIPSNDWVRHWPRRSPPCRAAPIPTNWTTVRSASEAVVASSPGAS